MIKRDLIRRYRVEVDEDGYGGEPVSFIPLEWVKTHVSIKTKSFTLTQEGQVDTLMIEVVSDIKLDEYIKTRYEWNNKKFKLMRQIKRGNEYFSTLLETQE